MDLVVTADGLLTHGRHTMRCALGRTGVRPDKCEGDGATPAGRFALREVMVRPDRILVTPQTPLPLRPMQPHDGWCDDPADAAYNRLVRLPHPARHERLWREDHLYDLLCVIGYNDDPVVPGRGSAIFLHVATPDFGSTEGCVAVALADLHRLLESMDPADHLVISADAG